MVFEDYMNLYGPDDRCAVCGKTISGGRGFAHLKHSGEWITLCCPLCMETFDKSPLAYVNRKKVRKITRPVQKLEPSGKEA